MLGVDDYGSDSSDTEDVPKAAPQPALKKPEPAPAPKAKKPVRIVVDALPKQSRALEDAEDDRPAKRPRVEAGKGRSSLLSMLPAPKVASAVPPAPSLGATGSGSGSGSSLGASVTHNETDDVDAPEEPARPALLVPTAVKKAAAAAKPKQPAVNFFSFGRSLFCSERRLAC